MDNRKYRLMLLLLLTFILASSGCKETAVPKSSKKEITPTNEVVKINSKKAIHNYQRLHSIKSDRHGNFYALGKVANYKKSALLIKFDKHGKILWERVSNSVFTEMAVDAKGNVYVVGESWIKSNQKALILKYNSNGKRVWQKIFSGSGDEKFINIFLKNDVLYAVGKTSSSDGNIAIKNRGRYDALIVKLDHDGKKIWVKTFGGRGNEVFNAVSVDRQGDIYAVGDTDTYGTDVMSFSAALMVKYSASGELLWDKTVNATPKNSESLHDMSAIKDGFYVSGYIGRENVLMWVDSQGMFVWKKSIGISESNTLKMITDTKRNIYVVGHDKQYKSLIIKFDSGGNRLWKRSIGSASSSKLFDVCIGTSNEVYTVGEEVHPRVLPPGAFCAVGEEDVGALIAKFSTDGKMLWGYSIDGDR